MRKSIPSLFLISLLSSCHAFVFLQSRDNGKQQTALDVPLALDSQGRYSVDVNMVR
jgi:hypothetical protein